MLGQVAAFEFRYQVRSAFFFASAAVLFLIAFSDMAIVKLGTVGGGNLLYNAPHAIIVTHLIMSLVFLFLGAAFVSNVIVRDDQSGFGAIIRTTRITKADYLFGRFAGAFAAGALVLAAVPLGVFLGTLMPFADLQMLGPNRVTGFAYGYGLFALPNALIISAILFALATWTRSTAGTFVGVVVLLIAYLVSQRLIDGPLHLADYRPLADPFGTSAYMAGARYLTAAQFNAGIVPVTPMLVASRLLWVCVSLAILALTYSRFRLSEPRISRRRARRLAREAAAGAAAETPSARPQFPPLPAPRFGTRMAIAQLVARASFEARFIFKGPVFLILLAIAFAFSLPSVLTVSGWMDVPVYPLTSVVIPIVDASFRTLLVVIATYYGGELVWRERERKTHEIIGATPLPSWALMLPKMVGLALVLIATLVVGCAVGVLAQLLLGGVEPRPGEFLQWYLLPGAVDALLTASLAVFVQTLSPSKYAGWGVMFVYVVLLVFGPSLGLEYPLLIYGNLPPAPLSGMAGTGTAATAAWWFRLFWSALAVLLLVAVQLLLPRGAQESLRRRFRALPARLTRGTAIAGMAALAVTAISGSWIVYNTLVLNRFESASAEKRHLAEYEKRYFRYARLPQPAVAHVALQVALLPAEQRAEVSGRYTLVNDSGAPIDRVHVRLMSPGLELLELNFPGTHLERHDREFAYRIYRLDRPMQPGEQRLLSFRTRRSQIGFTAWGGEGKIVPNGTDLDTLALTPRIGMSDVGLLENAAARRKYGLPEQRPLPRLHDVGATMLVPSGGDAGWTSSDIIVSTPADEIAVATGRQVSARVENGRRIVRFLSDAPVKNLLPVHAARYAIARQQRDGVDFAIYFDPAHRWNVARMMTAMQTAVAYYSRAFGRYQFHEARVVETPYREGGHAYPGTLAVGEGIFEMDLRSPNTLDMVTMLTAHEMAHQWWGHQVVGARMQGGSLLYETLAQYSALMVLKKLRGDTDVRRFLAFQLDRYLSGRRTQVLPEQPLASVEISQAYVAYGKGALALYLLQERMGEEAVNRALRRFAQRYRFKGAPYPRSVDLIALLRAEARTPADQALITDLFQRITLYDLEVSDAVTRKDSSGWTTSFTVTGGKSYANGTGGERRATLDEPILIGLFAMHPAESGFGAEKVLLMKSLRVRSGSQKLSFHTAVRPAFVGVDPYGLYIDRNTNDNVKEVRGTD